MEIWKNKKVKRAEGYRGISKDIGENIVKDD